MDELYVGMKYSGWNLHFIVPYLVMEFHYYSSFFDVGRVCPVTLIAVRNSSSSLFLWIMIFIIVLEFVNLESLSVTL